MLRLVAMLPSSTKLWSHCMLAVFEKYDALGDPRHLGQGKSCAEILSVLHLVLEERACCS